jgi:hypothetical protein
LITIAEEPTPPGGFPDTNYRIKLDLGQIGVVVWVKINPV